MLVRFVSPWPWSRSPAVGRARGGFMRRSGIRSGILGIALVLVSACGAGSDSASDDPSGGSELDSLDTVEFKTRRKETIAPVLVRRVETKEARKPALVYYAVDTEEAFFQAAADYHV